MVLASSESKFAPTTTADRLVRRLSSSTEAIIVRQDVYQRLQGRTKPTASVVTDGTMHTQKSLTGPLGDMTPNETVSRAQDSLKLLTNGTWNYYYHFGEDFFRTDIVGGKPFVNTERGAVSPPPLPISKSSLQQLDRKCSELNISNATNTSQSKCDLNTVLNKYLDPEYFISVPSSGSSESIFSKRSGKQSCMGSDDTAYDVIDTGSRKQSAAYASFSKYSFVPKEPSEYAVYSGVIRSPITFLFEISMIF